MTRTTSRRRATPALAITPRHVWLATLGLAARSRRQALHLGEQAQGNVTHWRAAIGARAFGIEQAVRQTGERLQDEVQTRVQPLLVRVGLRPRSTAKSRKAPTGKTAARKTSARKAVRAATPRRAPRKAARRRA